MQPCHRSIILSPELAQPGGNCASLNYLRHYSIKNLLMHSVLVSKYSFMVVLKSVKMLRNTKTTVLMAGSVVLLHCNSAPPVAFKVEPQQQQHYHIG